MKLALSRYASSMLLATVTPSLALAQTAEEVGAGGAGCAACAGCGGFVIFLVIAMIVLNIALLVWVARDAKARGMDSSILWMLLVAFTGVIGLIIYVFARPQGNMVQCPNCQNKKLAHGVKCPHCGFSVLPGHG